MMKKNKININNYFNYFIDFIDGNLSAEQIDELSAFLIKYPKLSEELEHIRITKLIPQDGISYTRKSELMKANEIESDSIEEVTYLSIAQLENDITPNESNQLKHLIETSALNYNEYQTIARLKLTPDKDEQFTGKNAIKRVVLLNVTYKQINRIASFAATIAATLTISYFYSRQVNNTYIHREPISSNENNSQIEKIEVKEYVAFESNNIKQNTKRLTPSNASATLNEVKNEVEEYSNINDNEIKNISPIQISEIKTNKKINVQLSYADLVVVNPIREENIKENFIASRRKEIGFFELAELGVKKLSDYTGTSISLNGQRDEKGNLTRVYFDAGLFAISHPVKTKKQE